MEIETKLLHAGIEPDSATGAVMTPIYQSSTFAKTYSNKKSEFSYSRTKNPTRSVFEDNIAAIENAKYGIAFSSGMSAIDSLLRLLQPGDEVITTHDIYGGSYRLFATVFQNIGIKFNFVDLSIPENIKEWITDRTRLIWVETPTNPMMNILDIQKIAEFSNDEIIVAVDNTFASPYLQNPIDLGADVVMHSVTKYIAGHSDVVMGALVTNDAILAKKLYAIQNSCGAIPGPQDCFLAIRGLKTLHVRMDRHCYNANQIALFLEGHPKVGQVNYPGLTSHPTHELAKNQMKNFGGMISFSLKENSEEAAKLLMTRTRLFTMAESLGGVESLIGHPATMTHSALPISQRKKIGIKESLIRISVGIENVTDLIQDLKNSIN